MSKPWYNKKWGTDKICGITLSRLRPGKNKNGVSYCVYLSCGHGFYRKPLRLAILKRNMFCPLCRKEINQHDLLGMAILKY